MAAGHPHSEPSGTAATQIASHIRVLPSEAGAFVMNVASDRCFGVNQTGAAILRCLQAGLTSPEDIAHKITCDAESRGISLDCDRVGAAVAGFIRQLADVGIVE